ncbi:hypothetical protein NDU88_003255 [Pleurodeles waltl]|uniref:Uncharacterized protein n=1 Tax=Pleurodeles waltl TaxID=8319 RepID=A0AAV7RCD4_PLEWA|nr:hypothetical protein NDU88_003255 [Pleurodeles waltl]
MATGGVVLLQGPVCFRASRICIVSIGVELGAKGPESQGRDGAKSLSVGGKRQEGTGKESRPLLLAVRSSSLISLGGGAPNIQAAPTAPATKVGISLRPSSAAHRARSCPPGPASPQPPAPGAPSRPQLRSPVAHRSPERDRTTVGPRGKRRPSNTRPGGTRTSSEPPGVRAPGQTSASRRKARHTTGLGPQTRSDPRSGPGPPPRRTNRLFRVRDLPQLLWGSPGCSWLYRDQDYYAERRTVSGAPSSSVRSGRHLDHAPFGCKINV